MPSENIDQNAVVDLDVGEFIDDYLKREDRPKEIGAYYPSEIGMCIRRSYYSYLFPKASSPDTLRIFALGNAVHDLIADALKAAGDTLEIENEKPVSLSYQDKDTSFKVYGRIDDVVVLKSNARKLLIEAKSVSDVMRVNEPEKKHIMQLMLYLSIEKADYGILVYVDKKNLAIRQFRVDYDETTFKQIMARFKDLDRYLRDTKLPPAEFYFDDKNVWQCRYCPYFNECMDAILKNQ